MTCDHKFIDSKRCLKCGWEPPARSSQPPAPRFVSHEVLTMQTPSLWPFKVLLPLAHRTRVDELGSPVCGVIAIGHKARVYLANVGDFEPAELQSKIAFERALQRFESVSYLSFSAALADGWRVD
jgi:hypothetical protein